MTKGTCFELEVFDAVRRNLGQFGLRPDACLVHYRKGYFSKDRHRKIIFDISIELYVSGSEQPSLIWVWECKDYSNPVPVSDVEEFHAKIQQLGEDNTKGTLISRGVLQKSALAYAISKGIGVARFPARQDPLGCLL
ncbi:MAG: restriction endonuclease [Acidobacteria bacterium]|nr:restriction endonuclease [Acidobacteriota bacterium]